MYLNGTGFKADLGKAVNYMDKACSMNNDVACVNLGLIYSEDSGMEKDPAKAGEYFDRACKLGNEKGCDLAGEIKE